MHACLFGTLRLTRCSCGVRCLWSGVTVPGSMPILSQPSLPPLGKAVSPGPAPVLAAGAWFGNFSFEKPAGACRGHSQKRHLQAGARLCSGTMPLDEGWSCLTSARPRQAATFQQLGARVFPACAVLPAAQAAAGCQSRGQCIDVGDHAGPEILQLIADQLSAAQWAQTLAQVCLGLQLMPK